MSTSFHTGLTVKNKFGKPTPIYSIEEVEHKKLVTDIEIAEREEAEAMAVAHEIMAKAKARVALLKADADIVRLRGERDEVEALEEAKYDTEINRLVALRHDVRVKREALRRGERDGELTAVSVARATDFVVTTRDERPVARMRPEGEKRVRKVIHRPPLCDLIKSRLNFKWEGKTCYTDNGKEFLEPDGTVFRSLNSWTETIIERGGGGGRKVSVYEVVSVQNNSTGKWKKWGEVYTKDCTSLQF